MVGINQTNHNNQNTIHCKTTLNCLVIKSLNIGIYSDKSEQVLRFEICTLEF